MAIVSVAVCLRDCSTYTTANQFMQFVLIRFQPNKLYELDVDAVSNVIDAGVDSF